jgi:hypothetical protein
MNKKTLGIALVLFTLVTISSVFADESARVSFDDTTVYVKNPNPAKIREGNKTVDGPVVSGAVCITVEHQESGNSRTEDEDYEVAAGKEELVYRLRSSLVDAGWRITGASINSCYVIPSSD